MTMLQLLRDLPLEVRHLFSIRRKKEGISLEVPESSLPPGFLLEGVTNRKGRSLYKVMARSRKSDSTYWHVRIRLVTNESHRWVTRSTIEPYGLAAVILFRGIRIPVDLVRQKPFAFFGYEIYPWKGVGVHGSIQVQVDYAEGPKNM